MSFSDFPSGMDGDDLWEPYSRAKWVVEHYPENPQQPGCELSLIRYDPAATFLELHMQGLKLPSSCPRFASRACPRMESMGHEAKHASCNYWDYPHMVEYVPHLELYPEWQRFDCHKYFALFQVHLVGAEMARDLKCTLRLIAPETDAALLKVYASLSSNPLSFSVLR